MPMDDKILIAGAAGLVLLGVLSRRRTTYLVPVPVIDDNGDTRMVSTGPNSGTSKPKPVPKTFLPLRTETAIRGGAQNWVAIGNDKNNVASLTTYLRSAAAQALGSMMPAEYYWPWITSELAKLGAASQNLALARLTARNLGPKA